MKIHVKVAWHRTDMQEMWLFSQSPPTGRTGSRLIKGNSFKQALRDAYFWLLYLVFGLNAPLFFQNEILQSDQYYMAGGILG